MIIAAECQLMKKRAYPGVKELRAFETEALIDMLSDSTSKYTRLLLSAPHSEEFEDTRDHILHIQEELTNRSAENGAPHGQEPERA